MEKITKNAAVTMAEIAVMRLTGLTTVSLQTLTRRMEDAFAVLKTVGVEALTIDGQTVALDDLYDQLINKLEDALLSAVSMNAHFVRSATVIDDGFGTKTVKVTLHRD